jgi:hypothetical protein
MQQPKSQSILRMIKSLDRFGNQVNFNINGKEKLKSTTGGLLSLLINFLLVAIIIYNIIDFSQNNNPVSNITKRFRNLTEIDTLDHNVLNITTFLISTNGQVTPFRLNSTKSEIFQVKLNLSDTNHNIDAYQIGSFIDCASSTYSNPAFTSFDLVKNYSYCSSIGKNNHMQLGGDLLGNQLQYSVSGLLKLNLCELMNCTDRATLNVVSNYFQVKMGFYIDNRYINVDMPYGSSRFIEPTVYDIDLTQNYIVEIQLTKNTMYTDINPIYSFYPPQVDIFYSYVIKLKPKQRPDYDFDFNINIELTNDNYEFVINRSYIKFDDVLAKILSMYQVLAMIVAIIHNVLSYGKVEYHVMRKLYDFPVHMPTESTGSKRPLTIIRLNDIELNLNNSKEAQFELKDTFTDKCIDSVNKFNAKIVQKPPKSNKVLMVFTIFTCCKRSKNTNFLLKTNSIVDCDLNIIAILKKLLEYEELKKIVLNDHQRNILPLMNSRVLHQDMHLDAFRQDISEQFTLKTDNQSINYYISYYEHLSMSNDPVEKRIYQELSKKLGTI